MKTVAALTKRRQDLQGELNALVERRAACRTQEERLKLIPEAVRITGEMHQVETEFEELTGLKMKGSFD